MQAGGHAGRARLGQMASERGERDVAPAAVERADAAQVAGEVSGIDEPRERVLVERAGRDVVVELLAAQVRDQRLGGGEPPDPQERADGLAHAPAVDDALGRQAL